MSAYNGQLRTGKTLVEDLNRLTGPRPVYKKLKPIEPIGALPPSRSRGVYQEPSAGKGGAGGLRSPISEISRTYYPAQIFESSDGLVSFTLRRTRELVMRDADGVEEVRVFSDAD